MPRYEQFEIIKGSELDNFAFGAITEYEGPDSHECGDVYCVAPDGSHAGVVWYDITCNNLDEDAKVPKKLNHVSVIEESPPEVGEKKEDDYWGLYRVYFPGPVRGSQQLTRYLHAALPQLKLFHEAWKKRIID